MSKSERSCHRKKNLLRCDDHIRHLFWIRFVRKWMRNCILLPKCTGNNHKHVEVTDKLTPNHVTARKRAVQVRPAG